MNIPQTTQKLKPFTVPQEPTERNLHALRCHVEKACVKHHASLDYVRWNATYFVFVLAFHNSRGFSTQVTLPYATLAKMGSPATLDAWLDGLLTGVTNMDFTLSETDPRRQMVKRAWQGG